MDFAAFIFFACKKEQNQPGSVSPPNTPNTDTTKKNNPKTYKIKFTVTGTKITKFTARYNTIDLPLATLFSGTKDTTLNLKASTSLKLDSNPTSPALPGPFMWMK